MPEHVHYRTWGKRFFDIAGALALLVVTLPILVCVAAAVRITMGSPVLFRQRRPGWGGEMFLLTKFRTMRPADTRVAGTGADDARLSAVGRWLRSSSLDELPELVHVISGRMSLVGPRPLLPQYLPLYSARQARRHEVRPGITGLAQVSGRNAIDWDTRLELDVQYVERMSFALDCRILAMTIGQVLRREGISQDGRATVDEFRGSRVP